MDIEKIDNMIKRLNESQQYADECFAKMIETHLELTARTNQMIGELYTLKKLEEQTNGL